MEPIRYERPGAAGIGFRVPNTNGHGWFFGQLSGASYTEHQRHNSVVLLNVRAQRYLHGVSNFGHEQHTSQSNRHNANDRDGSNHADSNHQLALAAFSSDGSNGICDAATVQQTVEADLSVRIFDAPNWWVRRIISFDATASSAASNFAFVYRDGRGKFARSLAATSDSNARGD